MAMFTFRLFLPVHHHHPVHDVIGVALLGEDRPVGGGHAGVLGDGGTQCGHPAGPLATARLRHCLHHGLQGSHLPRGPADPRPRPRCLLHPHLEVHRPHEDPQRVTVTQTKAQAAANELSRCQTLVNTVWFDVNKVTCIGLIIFFCGLMSMKLFICNTFWFDVREVIC